MAIDVLSRVVRILGRAQKEFRREAEPYFYLSRMSQKTGGRAGSQKLAACLAGPSFSRSMGHGLQPGVLPRNIRNLRHFS